MANNNIHKNHRQRLRERYAKNGLGAFAQHEILELLLFHSIPRADTNPTAHRLIQKYGSLREVLSMPVEELCKNEGVGKSSATFLNLIGNLSKYLSSPDSADKGAKNNLSAYDAGGEFAARLLCEEKTECVIAILLDAGDNFICSQKIGEGSFTASGIDLRGLTRLCLLKDAAKVILAHNHPDGSLSPSLQDKSITVSAGSLLSQIGVLLKEHYIVAGNSFVGLKRFSDM